ncbi:hypothetical protein AQUCO_07200049v1 [Aquilegia coerulea]|uniref:Uncharacterized protein n=1 Tax=Aquilegia coerulea TaxID=218851 RepID=A0A2G5CA39_AQUCA|nr:hypothetical protein AQUCO_07200049v1 [Aquilegia coerulea]
MSRSMVLVFLLLILIITSQFDWKQQMVSEIEATPSISNKNQHYSNREEAIKEKRGLFRLNEFVHSLQEQLQQCRGSNRTRNGVVHQLTENVNGHMRQPILDD